MRTKEELRGTLRSSLVFTVDDEDTAKELLKGNSLAAFARYCPLWAYQDRPPVKQCKNCWGWDHSANKCKELTRCRLCAGDHKKEDHVADQDCSKCEALKQSDGMEIDRNACTHNLHCTNCSTATQVTDKNHTADTRRCPIRLEKYGTAWTNKRKALKSDNPWKTVSTKKPQKPKTTNPTATTTQNPPPEQIASQNQFSIFEDPNPATHIKEDTFDQ